MNFAPPPSYDEKPSPPPPEPAANIPDDPTGEDAYARRLRLSQQQSMPQSSYPPPPPPPNQPQPPADPSTPPPPPPSAPVETSTISRAPVRYNLPPPPADIPSTDAELEAQLAQEEAAPSADTIDTDAPRSLRPGQKGFAERLLSKYGWTKGSGLGATGSGIINPLRIQVEKQKKRPDAEGGGFAIPGGRGKIIGGKKGDGSRAGEGAEGKFGEMSEVVVVRGMLRGLDLDVELGGEEGGLMQEIGEECGEKVRFIPISAMLAFGERVEDLEGRANTCI